MLRACTAGFIEYWSCEDYKHPAAAVRFAMKMDTDLFALAKAKTSARSLEVWQARNAAEVSFGFGWWRRMCM
jgi:peptidylprolyl isomerase domain and WD repeat-containing protein 1